MADRMTPEALHALIDTLHAGDDVEAVFTATVTGEWTIRGRVWRAGSGLRVGNNSIRDAVSLRVIKRANPGCPFAEGMKLRDKTNGIMLSADWSWDWVGEENGGWVVFDGIPFSASDLEVVPSCPFVVGQAVRAKSTGLLWTVIGVNGLRINLRAANYPRSELHNVRADDYAPIPEPPVGTPVWWTGEWYGGKRLPNGNIMYDQVRYSNAGSLRWDEMLGAIPAEIPGGAK